MSQENTIEELLIRGWEIINSSPIEVNNQFAGYKLLVQQKELNRLKVVILVIEQDKVKTNRIFDVQ